MSAKMTIKEAGRYANFLDEMRQKFSSLAYSGIESKLVKVTENHKKSEAYKEAEDEIIEVEFEDEIDVELDVLTEILEDIVKEKIALANAIANAKREIDIKVDENTVLDLDSSIEYAKLLRKLSSDYFHPLVIRKDSKTKESRRAFAFNVEGNQTPYFYEVEIERKLKYDKEKLIKKDKKNRLLADEISQEIDKAMNSSIVEFQPRYSYLDSMEDIVSSKLEELEKRKEIE